MDVHIDSSPALDLAVAIAQRVRDARGRALIVGGWVRDQLMSRPSKDLDLEVDAIDAAGAL